MHDKGSDQLAIALSGGGHRATLFAVGSLMALVDRELNRAIVQVASVSGGSIANAFIAQRCELQALSPGELDPIARDFVDALRQWRFDSERGESEGVAERLVSMMTELADRQPRPKFSRAGVLDYDAVDDLTYTRGWERLETLARGDVNCPTTLGRISPEMARRLLARGYLNTWLTTLLLNLDPPFR